MRIKANKIIKKFGFYARKHTPEILTGVSLGSGAACVILSNKATHDNFDTIVAEHNEAMEDIRENSENIKKDTVKQYAKTAGKFAKAYGPALACGVISAGTNVKCYKLQKKTNIELAGAYMALDQGFKKYRDGVAERFGDEVDKELRAGVKKDQEVIETDENGKEKTKKKKAVPEDFSPSDTSRFFDT